MTDPAIERAARELFKDEPGPYAGCIDEAIDEPYGWRDHVYTVEIVLKALRDPSERTIEAGNRAKPYNLQGYCEGKIHPVAKRPWQAMIDHLLAQITPNA